MNSYGDGYGNTQGGGEGDGNRFIGMHLGHDLAYGNRRGDGWTYGYGCGNVRGGGTGNGYAFGYGSLDGNGWGSMEL